MRYAEKRRGTTLRHTAYCNRCVVIVVCLCYVRARSCDDVVVVVLLCFLLCARQAKRSDGAVGKVSKTATRGVASLMVGNVDLVSS